LYSDIVCKQFYILHRSILTPFAGHAKNQFCMYCDLDIRFGIFYNKRRFSTI